MLALGTGTVGVMAASAPGILVAGVGGVYFDEPEITNTAVRRCLTCLIRQGRKDFTPIHLRRLQVYSLKIIQRVWKQRWQPTLQEQLLKAGLVTSKKVGEGGENGEKSRVQAREARAAVEENKRHSLSVINSLANSKNKRRWRKNIKLR